LYEENGNGKTLHASPDGVIVSSFADRMHPNVWVAIGGGLGGPGFDERSISTDDGETWKVFRVICA
jgi:hypothetical protein